MNHHRRQLGAAFDPATFINAIPGGAQFVAYAKAEVADSARQAVLPYIVGAYALSGAAVILSLFALIRRR